MRRYLIVCCLFIFNTQLFCQLADDFSDGDFSAAPEWIGNDANFIINEDNQLQLNAPEGGESSLFTEISLADSVRWSAYCKMDFSPSTSNLLRVYLAADDGNPDAMNAMYFEVGASGSVDALDLYEVIDGDRNLLASATEGSLGEDPAEFTFTLEKTTSNDWTLIVQYGQSPNLIVEWQINHNSPILNSAAWFGFYCKYTSTRTDKFFFDDIVVEPLLPDTEAPQLVSGTIITAQQIKLNFNEPMDINSLNNIQNYSITPGNFTINNVTANSSNPSESIIDFTPSLEGGTTYTVEVSNVADENGNVLSSDIISLSGESPSVLSAVVLDNNQIEVTFSEVMDQSSVEEVGNYNLIPTLGQPDDVFYNAEGNSCVLVFDSGFVSGTIYTLAVSNVSNELLFPIADTEIEVVVIERAEPGDLIVNEILSNPNSGGFDFIEIYNNSQKFISHSSIYIVNQDKENSEEQLLSTGIIKPGQYLAICADLDWLASEYTIQNPENLLSNKLPSFNDADGNVSILTPNDFGGLQIIDAVDYDEDWHYVLIRDEESVSLERLNFNSNSNDSLNWHSAASTAGFATPGYKNSQGIALIETNENFTIQEKIFSPNEDGEGDLLIMNYNFEKSGYTGTVKVFNDRGMFIRELYDQTTFGTQGFLTWDGTKNDLQKASVGIYIITYEFFHPDGDVINGKTTAVVADFLD